MHGFEEYMETEETDSVGGEGQASWGFALGAGDEKPRTEIVKEAGLGER